MPDDALPPDEQAILDRVGPVVRAIEPADAVLDDAPPGLWDRIAADAFDGTPSATDATEATSDPAPAPMRLAPRRRGRVLWLAAAAAVAVVVGLAAVVVLAADDDDTGTVVATAELDPLTARATGGSAELVDDDGTLKLRVDPGALDAGDGFLELWVIDPEVQQLISLGPVRPDGLYDLPPGIDPEAFPIVDVSVEAFDGDPTHSGDSLVRGQLVF
jgi:anti-sigma-K factor RskA